MRRSDTPLVALALGVFAFVVVWALCGGPLMLLLGLKP